MSLRAAVYGTKYYISNHQIELILIAKLSPTSLEKIHPWNFIDQPDSSMMLTILRTYRKSVKRMSGKKHILNNFCLEVKWGHSFI